MVSEREREWERETETEVETEGETNRVWLVGCGPGLQTRTRILTIQTITFNLSKKVELLSTEMEPVTILSDPCPTFVLTFCCVGGNSL